MEKLLKERLLEDNCDHNCKECGLWIDAEKMCFNELHKKWERWNKAEHERFSKVLRGENETNNIQ